MIERKTIYSYKLLQFLLSCQSLIVHHWTQVSPNSFIYYSIDETSNSQ